MIAKTAEQLAEEQLSRKRKRPDLFDESGQRKKYFEDDDVSLETLVTREVFCIAKYTYTLLTRIETG